MSEAIEASEARKTAILATSSGAPGRPSGVIAIDLGLHLRADADLGQTLGLD